MKLLFKRVQQRYVVVAMMFLSMAVTFALRMSFPIVLTQMVYVPNTQPETNSTKLVTICPVKNESHMVDHIDGIEMPFLVNNSERYQWSQKLQGVILSSFYLGNLLCEIPASMLVQKIGAKIMFLISVGLSMLITVLTPLAVHYGSYKGLIASRVILGLVQAPSTVSLSAFIIPWYPIEERGKLISLGYIGISAGAAISSLIAGYLIKYTGRWEYVFYVFAITLFILWIMFASILYEQPKDHPFISDDEREYLQRKLENFESERKHLPPTPWKSILTSTPVLALILSTGLYSWSFHIIHNDLPKYLNDVLHISIEKNAIYSAVPKLLSVVVSILAGILSDLMLTRWNVNPTHNRKIFVVLTSIIPSSFLMFASYAGCDEILSVSFLTVSIAAHGLNSAGAVINLFDLGPNYVAPVNAIINTFGTIVGMIAPYVAGILTPNALLSEWRMVFWITFVLHISESVVFTAFGSAKVQHWNSRNN